MQDPQVTAQRRTILRTVADLTEQYDLPAPMTIGMTSPSYIDIRIDGNDRDGVYRWAEVLDLGEVQHVVTGADTSNSFVSVHAEARSQGLFDATIYVWSACDIATGGEQG